MAIVYTQSDLVSQVRRRVDDTPATPDVVEWLNAGQNIMAVKAGAVFPQLDPSNGSSQFVFDDKWSEIPVLYACARYKQADLMLTDSQSYMQQFELRLSEFVMRYEVPIQYRDNEWTQHFTATDQQTDFEITKDGFDPITSDLIVYYNGSKMRSGYSPTDTGFSIDIPATDGDTITAVWEVHSDLIEPPYSHWSW